MSIKRIFIVISAIFAASAVFADNSSVTSKKYVDDLMSGYQGKLPGSGANKLMIYDDEDGIGEKTIEATLVENATGVPTVSAVKTGLDGKQDTITGTAGYVMTGMGTPGEVGERAIYGTAFYGDSLVTAENVNTGVTNAVNNSLIRVDANGNPSDSGTLWEINTDLFALGVLPAGYTQLEWIESNGTQYIDTGVIPNQNYKMVLDAQLKKSSGGEILVGSRASLNSRGFSIVGHAGGINWAGGYGDNSGVSEIASDLNRHTFEVGSNGFYIDNTKTLTYTQQTFTSPGNLVIGAVNNNGEIKFYSKAKFYSFKLWNGSTLVRNFIPASHVENSVTVVGMYDTVSGTFFPDAAGGNFIAGPAVAN